MRHSLRLDNDAEVFMMTLQAGRQTAASLMVDWEENRLGGGTTTKTLHKVTQAEFK